MIEDLTNNKYEIFYFDFAHPSFNWANGEYIIVYTEKDKTKAICRIENGLPDRYDGRISISHTSADGKSTGKFYNNSRNIRDRKLKRILK